MLDRYVSHGRLLAFGITYKAALISPTDRRPPRAFISYSHDSPEHERRVRAFAERLIAEGIDIVLDQYVVSPPEGWPRWMDRQIADADCVLLICTETYR